MLKQKSSPWARLKYLYVLPLAALTVVVFARPEISHELEKISSVKISEIISVQEKKEPKRNVEVDTLAKDSVISEKDIQAIQEKVSAVMEKYQLELDKAMKTIKIDDEAVQEASKVKSSFSGIVYIDGVESSKERMENLNPDRIASMNVYKGNEAIAKFGEKGRNGVIEIKLKKWFLLYM